MILINNILSRIKNELEVSTCYAKPTLQTVKWLTENFTVFIVSVRVLGCIGQGAFLMQKMILSCVAICHLSSTS